MDQTELAVLLQACNPGPVKSWYVSFDVEIHRLGDGRVRVTIPSGNRAVYQAFYAFVQGLIRRGDARDLRDGTREPRFSFSFTPVH